MKKLSMIEALLKGLRKFSNKFIHSIAFVPALIGIGFLVLAIIGIELDSNGVGEALNSRVKWLALNDASTARTIIGTVAAGIISLTVFSYSMVLVVINQAASQMSNRMLDNILGDNVQKVILGLYIGTIIYALFVSTTISEGSGNMNVPVLSIYVLLVLSIFDIFLFVYFLHYVSQYIRYEQLIQRIHNRAQRSLKQITAKEMQLASLNSFQYSDEIESKESGYFQGFPLKRLMAFACKHNIKIEFLHAEGTYILEGTPFLIIHSNNKLEYRLIEKVLMDVDFYYGQEVNSNPYFGYQHLMEVGIKALSPGINDPGTAVLSLNAIANLLLYKMQHTIQNTYNDTKGTTRIITKELSFEELFDMAVMPIWDYGQNDRLIQKTLIKVIGQLNYVDKQGVYKHILDELAAKVEAARLQRIKRKDLK